MKPISRRSLKSNNFLQEVGFGAENTVASIKGSVKELGAKYQDAFIVLYNKANLNVITVVRPDENSDYKILGLNSSLTCFLVALDSKMRYNAVIQDNVVPK